MTGSLTILRAGSAITVQDLGRPGNMAFGLSRGGAADKLAIVEGAVLLGQPLTCAALEMASAGGDFEASQDMRIALTGAPMGASLGGRALAWNASHFMQKGQLLTIGSTSSGVYGYLHVGGGITNEPELGSRATHLAVGIGGLLQTGDTLPVGSDPKPELVGQKLPQTNRFSGGGVRILPSVQTDKFSAENLNRFQSTRFTRTPRGNRQGVELSFEGEPFLTDSQLTILSEPMLEGDIQMTGAGAPFVLLPECQTTGGYPRIAAVVPEDLPIVSQAVPGTPLTFSFVSHEQACRTHRTHDLIYTDLKRKLQPLIRNPHEIKDLLSYQLISGMITGAEDN